MTQKRNKKQVLRSELTPDNVEKFSKLFDSAGGCKPSDAKIGGLRKPKGSGGVHPHPAFN